MSDRDLIADLVSALGETQVASRPIDRAAYASDASVYRMVPKVVVRPRTIADVQAVFAISRRHRVPMTFRAAGTSLSGQAVTDGILVDVGRHWKGIQVQDEGARVRVQPGAVGAAVNARLKPFRRKIGPDPASIQACMMGGILANNSSGMCCGVAQNAYHTLESLRLVLPSGTVVDTASPTAGAELAQREPMLAAGLQALAAQVRGNPALRERLRFKYRTKNTTGYSLNALLDFEQPVDILRQLIVGSEGTLAFIAHAELQTVPDWAVRYTGLLLFPSMADACRAIIPLRDAGAAALEVMDRAALRSVEHQPGVPPEIAGLGPDAAGLLVEFQADDESARERLTTTAGDVVNRLALAVPARFTHDAAEQAALWRVRQGMFPSVGSTRPRGTAVIIEDVAFPVERLGEAVVDLRALLDEHGYRDAIIFGHAKDGNLHFVLAQSFNDEAAVARYAGLMAAVVQLVVERYDGALKAEHGTGRNIAPFVETEWGAEAYEVMKRVKALFDPDGLLNPGVILTSDPHAHLAHLKGAPPIEAEVDRCIECGYCESQCPSRNLTLTPRQRIVVRREVERQRLTPAGQNEETLGAAGIERDFPYDALDTCAADGLCATACPVAIDTGQLTKRLRAMRHHAASKRVAGWIAEHFTVAERAVRLGLRAARLVRPLLPWFQPLPGAAPALPRTLREAASAVYVPSCLSRTMGHLRGEPGAISLPAAMVTLGDRAGCRLWIPPDVAGHCCGVPFSSKGYVEAHEQMARRTIRAMWRWSDGGRLPIVMDTSPCAYGLRTSRDHLDAESQAMFDGLQILDGAQFIAEQLLPRLSVKRRVAHVALHPVCSLTKMQLTDRLSTIAEACAARVSIPEGAGCCGFAGDRGWLVPSLTASATAAEAASVAALAADGHFSTSRTCEIGMTRATGAVYRSIAFLIEEATRP